MKLLGWMHRKFRQNSCETPKDHFATGQAYLDDLQCYNGGTGNNNCKPFSKTQRYRRNSFTSLESARDDHDNNLNNEDHELTEPTSESDMTELFHGFLAIGTLGSHEFAAVTDNDVQDEEEDNDYYPSTPRFTMDHIAEKQTQEAITENELKLINDELEKVLNIGDDDDIASSGRNSHVSSSAGRFSHVSAITLSGNNNRISDVCPLQSYLLGTAAAATTTETAAAAAVKKEQRTSLGELFQKTKQAEEINSGVKSERDKSAVRLVKKMLKKRIVHAIDSETKLNKILQIFSRKVHPENYSAEDSACNNKKEIKNINDDEMMMKNSESVPLVGCNNYSVGTIRRSSSAEDIIIYPDQHPIINKNGNEFWVKTDSDYLVLEL